MSGGCHDIFCLQVKGKRFTAFDSPPPYFGRGAYSVDSTSPSPYSGGDDAAPAEPRQSAHGGPATPSMEEQAVQVWPFV